MASIASIASSGGTNDVTGSVGGVGGSAGASRELDAAVPRGALLDTSAHRARTDLARHRHHAPLHSSHSPHSPHSLSNASSVSMIDFLNSVSFLFIMFYWSNLFFLIKSTASIIWTLIKRLLAHPACVFLTLPECDSCILNINNQLENVEPVFSYRIKTDR